MSNSISKYSVIRVTPTLDTSAYGDNEVLFNATEIPNAVLGNGGCSKLISVSIVSQNTTMVDMDIVFMQVTKNLGTINAAVDISDANLEAAKMLGYVSLDGSNSGISLVNGILYTTAAGAEGTTQLDRSFPILLQAESNSTSIYFSAILRDQTPTYAADDLDFVFHIER